MSALPLKADMLSASGSREHFMSTRPSQQREVYLCQRHEAWHSKTSVIPSTAQARCMFGKRIDFGNCRSRA